MGTGRKIVWDSASHTIFLECCIEEVNRGNKPGSHFNRIGWKNLIRNFNARANRNYNKVQLKNHWDVMKNDWKLWNWLMRTESGIRWDPIRKIIDASPQWWEDTIKANPKLAKFRDRNLEKYEKYYAPIFRDSVVVGNTSMAPSELPCTIGRCNGVDEIVSESSDDTGDGDELLADDDIADEEGDDGVQGQQSITAGIVSPQTCLKRSGSQHPSTSNGKRAKLSTGTIWKKQLDTLLQALLSRSIANASSSEPSILECTQMLAELPGVEVASQFWNEVCVMFWKDEVRLGFASQPTREAKLSYVKFIAEKIKGFPPSFFF